MKKILIVGTGSYVGEGVKEFLSEYPNDYKIKILSSRGLKPQKIMFRDYDVVFFVAGIAHRKENRKNTHLYYAVNRDLAIKAAKNAKAAGVRQFIMMSTIAVYGLTEGVIKKKTRPHPVSHYGKSKLAADRAVWKMRGADFKVAILRAPMIYGKGCKGNYQRLRKLALAIPVFPKIDNQRSMLYIGNLCWFVKELIDGERQGVFFPQNAKYMNTSKMVKAIGRAHGKRVVLVRGFDSLIKAMSKFMPFLNKVFGNLVIDKKLSECEVVYQLVGAMESIQETEEAVMVKPNETIE